MGAKIKVLNTDRGGEYQEEDFVNYLKSKGTHQKLNVHDTPQQVGVAERRNWTIGERIRALLHASGLPKFLWGEAACHVVWLLIVLFKNLSKQKQIVLQGPVRSRF